MTKKTKIVLNLICLAVLVVDAVLYTIAHNYGAALGWGVAGCWCLDSTLNVL